MSGDEQWTGNDPRGPPPFLTLSQALGQIEQLKKYGIKSACALPLTTVHRRVGILVLASEHPDAYSEEEVSFLKVVADMVVLQTVSVATI